ncbi:LytTR family DNA-binding domain-containing protein [Terrisporobacter mayombei]|uniref:HTH-type transcriptional regulator n=1 Tax=Terrisporobacter mayombei TaxID=1541 RepID=A0ABY9Q776_9FIRM|nr:LytTR family DNA-binding domain-containing protein [Terrisporobacter mayombei]MCC3868819.1 LytTR family transcriptional regulator [Terrisporobacter mayombei]WMT83051.1 putative HTH-type transcriptional regulator [Terrisporobacter mayombei]
MKIRIEVDERIEEDEVIVRCSQLNEEVSNIQKAITEIISQKTQITFYKDNVEYYISLAKILFFETEDANISAHTGDNIYQVKYKLYELEEILPNNFMRISKSTILNINHIYSITRNLTSSSIVEFQDTHKQVYVSRHYYKPLKFKLLEKRR